MLEAEFLPDFQNFYTKIFRKVSPFQKYILKNIYRMVKGSKNDKKSKFL